MVRFNTPAISLQYQDLMGLVEYIDRMSINKNKPVAIEWSVKVSCEYRVLQRTGHVTMCRDPEVCRQYTDLYVKKLLSKSVPKDLQTELDVSVVVTFKF